MPAFQKFIDASSSGRRVTASGTRLASGTVVQYKCVYKLLAEYELLQPSPLRIQLVHRSSLRDLQREMTYWKKFFRNFKEFLFKSKKYYNQYVSGVYKTIKTFFNYLLNDKGLPVGNYHKQFKVPSEIISPIVLTSNQLKYLIIDDAFHTSLSKPLQRTKDIFVFGCTVGLRFSDLMSLTRQNLQFTEQGNFILLNTIKTGTEVRIPLPAYLIKIINKYENHSGRFVLPRLSNTNFNLQLKVLIRQAGWRHNLLKRRIINGKFKEIKTSKGDTFCFCDHITSHTMRRTAITTLLIMGVPEMIVRRISGHAAGSKKFFKYVAIAEDYLNAQVISAFDKLISTTDLI